MEVRILSFPPIQWGLFMNNVSRFQKMIYLIKCGHGVSAVLNWIMFPIVLDHQYEEEISFQNNLKHGWK